MILSYLQSNCNQNEATNCAQSLPAPPAWLLGYLSLCMPHPLLTLTAAMPLPFALMTCQFLCIFNFMLMLMFALWKSEILPKNENENFM